MSEAPCFCTSLRKASRKLTSIYDEALEPAGINLAQFSLLRNVRRHGPLSLTRLGEIVALDRSTLGRNLRVLERMGLVSFAAVTDQRETAVRLTADGQARLERSTPLWETAQAGISKKLGADGTAQLQALLGAL